MVPGAASVLEYEIVMVIVIFYEGDKGVKTTESILESYRRSGQDMVDTLSLQPCNRGYTEETDRTFPATFDLPPPNIVQFDI